MIFVCGNQETDDKDMQDFFALMAKAGLVDELPENLIDAASAVAGCRTGICIYVYTGTG